jgi:hypothetical protein
VKDCAPPEWLSLMDEKLVLSMRSEVGGGIECLRFFCVASVIVFVFVEGEKGGTFLGRCGNIEYSTAIVTNNFQVNDGFIIHCAAQNNGTNICSLVPKSTRWKTKTSIKVGCAAERASRDETFSQEPLYVSQGNDDWNAGK